jgi:atypical dual specificity phosphatase
VDLPDSSRPNFSWIIEGRLAGLARPYTAEALAQLKKLGVTTLVTLTEQPLSDEMLALHDLPALHWPVTDYTAPTVEYTNQIVADIQRLLAEGQVVAVHCAYGLGRTGTVLACYLVAEGMKASDAVSTIRALRPGSIETDKQEELVSLYEYFVRGRNEGR